MTAKIVLGNGAIGLSTETGRLHISYNYALGKTEFFCVQELPHYCAVSLLFDAGQIAAMAEFVSPERAILLQRDFAAWFWKHRPGFVGLQINLDLIAEFFSEFRTAQLRAKIASWKGEPCVSITT